MTSLQTFYNENKGETFKMSSASHDNLQGKLVAYNVTKDRLILESNESSFGGTPEQWGLSDYEVIGDNLKSEQVYMVAFTTRLLTLATD